MMRRYSACLYERCLGRKTSKETPMPDGTPRCVPARFASGSSICRAVFEQVAAYACRQDERASGCSPLSPACRGGSVWPSMALKGLAAANPQDAPSACFDPSFRRRTSVPSVFRNETSHVCPPVPSKAHAPLLKKPTRASKRHRQLLPNGPSAHAVMADSADPRTQPLVSCKVH
jgi:hypothetical protein